MAMIGTDLSRLPAGDGDVAIGDFAEDFLDVMFWVPLLLAFKAEDVHGRGAPKETDINLAQGLAGQERDRCASAVRIDRRTFVRARSSMVRADRS